MGGGRRIASDLCLAARDPLSAHDLRVYLFLLVLASVLIVRPAGECADQLRFKGGRGSRSPRALRHNPRGVFGVCCGKLQSSARLPDWDWASVASREQLSSSVDDHVPDEPCPLKSPPPGTHAQARQQGLLQGSVPSVSPTTAAPVELNIRDVTGTRQAFLPGGHRTGAPGKHVVRGKAKYRLVDEQVRVFVAPPIEEIQASAVRISLPLQTLRPVLNVCSTLSSSPTSPRKSASRRKT